MDHLHPILLPAEEEENCLTELCNTCRNCSPQRLEEKGCVDSMMIKKGPLKLLNVKMPFPIDNTSWREVRCKMRAICCLKVIYCKQTLGKNPMFIKCILTVRAQVYFSSAQKNPTFCSEVHLINN